MSVPSIQIRLIPTSQIQAPPAEALALSAFGAPAAAAANGRMTSNRSTHRVRCLKRKEPEPEAAAGAGAAAAAAIAAAEAIAAATNDTSCQNGAARPSSCAAHSYAALLGAASHKGHVLKRAAAAAAGADSSDADPFESPTPAGTGVAAAAAAAANPVGKQLTWAHGAGIGRFNPSSHARSTHFGALSHRGHLPKEALATRQAAHAANATPELDRDARYISALRNVLPAVPQVLITLIFSYRERCLFNKAPTQSHELVVRDETQRDCEPFSLNYSQESETLIAIHNPSNPNHTQAHATVVPLRKGVAPIPLAVVGKLPTNTYVAVGPQLRHFYFYTRTGNEAFEFHRENTTLTQRGTFLFHLPPHHVICEGGRLFSIDAKGGIYMREGTGSFLLASPTDCLTSPERVVSDPYGVQYRNWGSRGCHFLGWAGTTLFSVTEFAIRAIDLSRPKWEPLYLADNRSQHHHLAATLNPNRDVLYVAYRNNANEHFIQSYTLPLSAQSASHPPLRREKTIYSLSALNETLVVLEARGLDAYVSVLDCDNRFRLLMEYTILDPNGFLLSSTNVRVFASFDRLVLNESGFRFSDPLADAMGMGRAQSRGTWISDF